jgi:hypothetical protein
VQKHTCLFKLLRFALKRLAVMAQMVLFSMRGEPFGCSQQYAVKARLWLVFTKSNLDYTLIYGMLVSFNIEGAYIYFSILPLVRSAKRKRMQKK